MCARQQGDLCNYRDKCDDEKGLYCDMKLDAGLRGVCRGATLFIDLLYESYTKYIEKKLAYIPTCQNIMC